MRCVIERDGSNWVLRFLASRRDDVRQLRANIRKATTLFMVMSGLGKVFQFITLVPRGRIHRHGNEWSLSFTARSEREALMTRDSVYKLDELLWWDGNHPCRRLGSTENEVKEHEEKCPDLHGMFC